MTNSLYTLDSIQEAIISLPDKDKAKLSKWLAEVDNQIWDNEIEGFEWKLQETRALIIIIQKEQDKLFIDYLDNLINYIDIKYPQIPMIRGSIWSMKEELLKK